MEKTYQPLTTRRANSSDIASINNILRASKGYWGYDEFFMNSFMERYALSDKYIKDNAVYVMFNNKNIIGFFSLVLHADHSLELDHFFIRPECVRKGYGKQLWTICSSVARDLGAEEFTLWSDPQAEDFYAKMGCEKIGVKKSPFMPDRYPPIMRFKLNQQVTQD